MNTAINITSVFSLYAARAADKAGIPADLKIARDCAELAFSAILETQAHTDLSSPLEKNKFATEETTAWLTPRYKSCEKYVPDFFKSFASYDQEAVITAMLCSEYLKLANLFSNSEDPTIPTIFRNESVDEDIISRAEDFINEAQQIVQIVLNGNILPSVFDPTPESIYLAHGFLWDRLTESDDAGYDECDTEQARNIKDNLLTPIRTFVYDYTVLGQDIIQHVNRIENNLKNVAVPEQHVPAPEKPTAKTSHLSIVQPTQP